MAFSGLVAMAAMPHRDALGSPESFGRYAQREGGATPLKAISAAAFKACNHGLLLRADIQMLHLLPPSLSSHAEQILHHANLSIPRADSLSGTLQPGTPFWAADSDRTVFLEFAAKMLLHQPPSLLVQEISARTRSAQRMRGVGSRCGSHKPTASGQQLLPCVFLLTCCLPWREVCPFHLCRCSAASLLGKVVACRGWKPWGRRLLAAQLWPRG